MISGVINIILGLLLIGWSEKRMKATKFTIQLLVVIVLGFAIMTLGVFKLVYTLGWW